MKRTALVALLLAAALPCQSLLAHDSAVAHQMTDAAQNFLKALNPEQRGKAQFKLDDTERQNWHFIPRVRKGLPIKEMTQAQRLLAHALLSTALSNGGYKKTVSIMSLEEILAEMEKGKVGGNVRDPENYYFSVFGEPGEKSGWGWRFEGHHVSLNFAADDDEVLSVTPSFFGTNPGEVKEGQRSGTRVLGYEEELGRSLVKSLNEEQKKVAVVLTEAPKEVFNVPGRNEFTKPEGLPQAQLNADQKEILNKIIREYIGRDRAEIASDDWAKIEKAGLEKITFAWAGGFERGEPHYYRVQGPTFVLEYDNTQNNANHVHALWRDLSNDFGTDLLKEHYKASHAAK